MEKEIVGYYQELRYKPFREIIEKIGVSDKEFPAQYDRYLYYKRYLKRHGEEPYRNIHNSMNPALSVFPVNNIRDMVLFLRDLNNGYEKVTNMRAKEFLDKYDNEKYSTYGYIIAKYSKDIETREELNKMVNKYIEWNWRRDQNSTIFRKDREVGTTMPPIHLLELLILMKG